MPSSSAVEQVTVNHFVVGSIPTWAAKVLTTLLPFFTCGGTAWYDQFVFLIVFGQPGYMNLARGDAIHGVESSLDGLLQK